MLSKIFRTAKETEKDLNRKTIQEEIMDIQKKKRFLTATIEDLIKVADKYALDAAENKGSQLLEWSKDLWSLIKAKEDEIKELDKSISSKENIWRKAFLLEKRISRKV